MFAIRVKDGECPPLKHVTCSPVLRTSSLPPPFGRPLSLSAIRPLPSDRFLSLTARRLPPSTWKTFSLQPSTLLLSEDSSPSTISSGRTSTLCRCRLLPPAILLVEVRIADVTIPARLDLALSNCTHLLYLPPRIQLGEYTSRVQLRF